MPQPRRELVPEARVDVPKVRPQGAMCKVVALIFQRIERLIFNLPPGASSPHEVKDVARAHPQVRHPAEVLDLAGAPLPVLDEIDPYMGVRGIQRHVIDKAEAMDHTGGAVVSL